MKLEKALELIKNGREEIYKLEYDKRKIKVVSKKDLSLYAPEESDFSCNQDYIKYCRLIGTETHLRALMDTLENYFSGEFYEEDAIVYPKEYFEGQFNSLLILKHLLS